MWRASMMPSAEERATAVAALRANLATVCEWETAVIEEEQVLLHA